MARTKYPIANNEITAGEMKVGWYARRWDSWRGTAEQLTDAGLIPDEFEWPSRTQYRRFKHGGFDCSVQRKPVPGVRAWVGVNNWCLMRYCAGRGDGAPEIYEKERALEHELWRRSAEGEQMWSRYCAARNDARFQALKRRVLLTAGGQ